MAKQPRSQKVTVGVHAPARRPARRTRWVIPGIIAVIFVAITLVTIQANLASNQVPPPAETGPIVRPIVAQAQAVPAMQSKLAFKTSGTVRTVAVKAGDTVAAGAVLIELDTADARLRLDDARAFLALQRALLAQAQEQASPEEIAAARAGVASATARLRQVEAGPTTGDLRAAEEAVRAAEAALAGAEAKLQQVRSGATVSDIASAEATVQSGQAQLASAEQRMADLRARPRPEDIRQAELGVEQARNALWSQQISRDAMCGRAGSASVECKAADANVAASETAVTTALAKLAETQKPASADDLRAGQEAVKSAQAAVTSAQTRVDQVRAGAANWDVASARSAVDQAAANLRSSSARLSQLREGPLAADVEAAKSAVEQATATLQVRLRGPTTAAIDAAQARVKQAEVQLALAELSQENLTLRSPVAGVVTSVGQHPGEVMAVGAPAVTVAQLERLRFETSDLDEVSAASVKVGQDVDIVVAALEKRSLKGRVTAIAPQPTITQSGDVNYTVTVELAEPAPDLRWGMTAKIDFTHR
jgi:multidrug resistance efflux pump